MAGKKKPEEKPVEETLKEAKPDLSELNAAAFEMATLDLNNATRSRVEAVQLRLRDEMKRAFPKLFV
jgi:hypothetical protein